MVSNGTKLINKAISQFDTLIKNIELGVNKNNVVKDKNAVKIADLQFTNKELTLKNEEGTKFAANLKKMLE